MRPANNTLRTRLNICRVLLLAVACLLFGNPQRGLAQLPQPLFDELDKHYQNAEYQTIIESMPPTPMPPKSMSPKSISDTPIAAEQAVALESIDEHVALERIRALALLATGQYTVALSRLRELDERMVEMLGSTQMVAQRWPILELQARLAELLGEREKAVGLRAAIWQAYRSGRVELNSNQIMAAAQAAESLARTQPMLARDALALYERASELAPNDVEPHLAIGALLLSRNNNAEARESFESALSVYPMNARASLGIARSERFDHSPHAQARLERVLDSRPTFAEARVELAAFHIDAEQYDLALEQINAALEVNELMPEALTLLAGVHYLRDQPEQFDTIKSTLFSATPGYPAFYVQLAELAASNRRYPEAVDFAQRAANSAEDNWHAHAILGANQLRLGFIDKARVALERAFAGNPFDVRSKNLLELLDRLRVFKSVRSKNIELVAPQAQIEVLADLLLPIAEEALDAMSKRYQIGLPSVLRIEIYHRHEDFSVRTVGLMGVDILGASFGPTIAMDSPSVQRFGSFNWASVVWHEIAHSFHMAMSRNRVPRWFSEGLAVHEERLARKGWGADVQPDFLRAFQSGLLAPASDMNSAFLRPKYAKQIPHAYFQASLLMELIEQKSGVEGIRAMLSGYAQGLTTKELLQSVLGVSAADFDAQFETFVETRYGHALAALDSSGGDEIEAREAETGMSYADLLEAGREAKADGDVDRALEQFRAAVAMVPEFAGPSSAYHLLAQTLFEVGREAAAVSVWRANIDIDADDLRAHQRLAQALQKLEDTESLATVLENSLLIDPFAVEAYQSLAHGYERAEQWDRAVKVRRALLALMPHDEIGARYALGRALGAAGDLEPALEQTLAALERAPMYSDALEQLLQLRAQIALTKQTQ